MDQISKIPVQNVFHDSKSDNYINYIQPVYSAFKSYFLQKLL